MNSKKTIFRISRYKNALYRFKTMGLNRVFSDNLAEAVGVISSQVRKDFSFCKIQGKKRGGYQIDELIAQLNEVLGKHDVQKVIIVGMGNIGAALTRYNGFAKENIEIMAGFDNDYAKLAPHAPIPIYHIDKMEDFVKENKVTIGIIAVPDMVAQQVLDQMVRSGIKGVLNFAPLRLSAPEDCFINSVNLVPELESVIYFSSKNRQKDIKE